MSVHSQLPYLLIFLVSALQIFGLPQYPVNPLAAEGQVCKEGSSPTCTCTNGICRDTSLSLPDLSLYGTISPTQASGFIKGNTHNLLSFDASNENGLFPSKDGLGITSHSQQQFDAKTNSNTISVDQALNGVDIIGAAQIGISNHDFFMTNSVLSNSGHGEATQSLQYE